MSDTLPASLFITVTDSSVRHITNQSVHHCNVQLCQTHYQPFCSSLYQWCHHCTRGVRYTTNKSVYNCTNGVTLPTSPFITVTVVSVTLPIFLFVPTVSYTLPMSAHHCTSGVRYTTTICTNAQYCTIGVRTIPPCLYPHQCLPITIPAVSGTLPPCIYLYQCLPITAPVSYTHLRAHETG